MTVEKKIDIKQWHRTNYGAIIGAEEADVLSEILPRVFGYRMLASGVLIEDWQAICSVSSIRQKIWLGNGEKPSVFCDSNVIFDRVSVPIQTDSIDLVILRHTLEMVDDPRRFIREIERIMIPDGRLLIFGFNSWSLPGLWGLAGGRKIMSDVNFSRTINYWRLREWLLLLGFKIEKIHFIGFRPPLNGVKILSKLEFLERWGNVAWPYFAGVYAIEAVKQVATLTPLKPKLRWKGKLSPNSVTAPTTTSRGLHGNG